MGWAEHGCGMEGTLTIRSRMQPAPPPYAPDEGGLSRLSLQSINRAMQKPYEEYSIGVLDIYGFEIFQVCVALL